MNKKIDSLTKELSKYLESGELALFKETFESLQNSFETHKTYYSELIFEEKLLPLRLKIDILQYQYNVSFFQGNFKEALNLLMNLSQKVNRIDAINYRYDLWKKLNDLCQERRHNDSDFEMIKTFVYLEYALCASLKYELIISGTKAMKAFMSLSILNKFNDQFGKLLNKVLLRINDQDIKNSYNNAFPHLTKKRFRDSDWENMREKGKKLDKTRDITIIQGL